MEPSADQGDARAPEEMSEADRDRALGIKERRAGYHTHDGRTWETDGRCYVCKESGDKRAAYEQGWVQRSDVATWLRYTARNSMSENALLWAADKLERGEAP